MKYVKLFEEFENANYPATDMKIGGSAKQYVYYIHNEKDENFRADIRDTDGKVVLEIDSSFFTNDSFMKNKHDLTGLQQILLSKNKIKPGDEVIFAKDLKAEMDANDFVKPINTNNSI